MTTIFDEIDLFDSYDIHKECTHKFILDYDGKIIEDDSTIEKKLCVCIYKNPSTYTDEYDKEESDEEESDEEESDEEGVNILIQTRVIYQKQHGITFRQAFVGQRIYFAEVN